MNYCLPRIFLTTKNCNRIMKRKIELMKKVIEDFDRNYAYIERFMDDSFRNSPGFNEAKREGRELDYILTCYRGKNKSAVRELAKELKSITSLSVLNEDENSPAKFNRQVVLLILTAIIFILLYNLSLNPP